MVKCSVAHLLKLTVRMIGVDLLLICAFTNSITERWRRLCGIHIVIAPICYTLEVLGDSLYK